MIYKQYKFKFYLNARYAVYTEGVLGDIRTRSWEFILHIIKGKSEFSQFNTIANSIQEYFEKYQDKYLNEIPPFDVINPTLENASDYFKTELAELLNKQGWMMLMMEVSETPTRTYVINMLDDIELSEDQAADTVSNLILDRVRGTQHDKN